MAEEPRIAASEAEDEAQAGDSEVWAAGGSLHLLHGAAADCCCSVEAAVAVDIPLHHDAEQAAVGS